MQAAALVAFVAVASFPLTTSVPLAFRSRVGSDEKLVATPCGRRPAACVHLVFELNRLLV